MYDLTGRHTAARSQKSKIIHRAVLLPVFILPNGDQVIPLAKSTSRNDYELPGGEIDVEPTLLSAKLAAIREFGEEFGITLGQNEVEHFKAKLNDGFEYGTIIRFESDEVVYKIYSWPFVAHIRVQKLPEIKLSNEHHAGTLIWVNINEIPNGDIPNISRVTIDLLQSLVRHR